MQNETFRICLISTVAYNPNTVNSSHTTIPVKKIRMQNHLQVITLSKIKKKTIRKLKKKKKKKEKKKESIHAFSVNITNEITPLPRMKAKLLFVVSD